MIRKSWEQKQNTIRISVSIVAAFHNANLFGIISGTRGMGTKILLVCEVASVVPDSATPGTVACQAPLSTVLSRQEHWSGLPFPSPEDLPDPGIMKMKEKNENVDLKLIIQKTKIMATSLITSCK